MAFSGRLSDAQWAGIAPHLPRWIVERTFAWLGWCRRLLVRHERLLSMYVAFFHLACAMLTLRQVLK